MAIRDYRIANLNPLPKRVDLRSASGMAAPSESRLAYNILSMEKDNLSRLGGWQALGRSSSESFLNQDLHDQLLSAYSATKAPGDPSPNHPSDTQVHQPVTMVSEVVNSEGNRVLLAGTRSRLYASTGDSGNWRTILDNVGIGDQADTSVRFRTASIANVTVICNGQDDVHSWEFQDSYSDTVEGSAHPIAELQVLGVTAAKHVASFKGFIFIGGVTENGIGKPDKIYWSDYNNPTSWFALPDSLSGFIELGGGERIMAMLPVGSQLRIYTDQAIYNVAMAGGDVRFTFTEIYRGSHVPVHENSVVASKSSHYYLSENTIIRLGEFEREPRETSWIHQAAGAIFNGVRPSHLADLPSALGLQSLDPINRTKCHLAVSGYDRSLNNLWFSWASGSSVSPNVSLVLNLDEESSCIVDHGFNAFASFARDGMISTRKWLAENGICEAGPDIKEGDPTPTTFTPSTKTHIRNETEDPDLAESAESLCSEIGDNFLDCQPCGSNFLFAMSDASDNTLKEFTPAGFLRESVTDRGTLQAWDDSGYDGTPDTVRSHPVSTATYLESGYVSLLQSDPTTLRVRGEKIFRRIDVPYDSIDHGTPAHLHCQIGYTPQPGQVQWSEDIPKKAIDRLTGSSNSDHQSNQTRMGHEAQFPFMRRGLLFAFRLIIADEDLAPVQGGDASFNQLVLRWLQATT